MNIQRFHAPTAREALAKARLAFGDAVLILSNRASANGVEVVATSEDTLQRLAAPTDKPSAGAASTSLASGKATAVSQDQVEADTEQLAMSTLSFQDYVRERMLQRRGEAAGKLEMTKPAMPTPPRLPEPAEPISIKPARKSAAPVRPAAAPAVPAAPVAATAAAVPTGIASELHAMKEMFEERFTTLAWLGQAKQDPLQANLMLKLIRAGYSPTLARAVLSKMPEKTPASEAVRWVVNMLAHNLRTDVAANPLHVDGGVYALVGATGVGKTTTAAKLAGLCAQLYGPGSVGLITLDTYRVGAHEQLRSYGRMLGVVAHLAHDQAALQDLLGLLAGKKMVLIDTTGMGPRDPRRRELFEVLNLPQIRHLLVLNAGSHGDTLDEMVGSFRSGANVQQAILSKIDEAAKLGPALDALIRHQLTLRGVTTGQKVPEDWEPADAGKLVRLSMRAPHKSAFDPQMEDLGLFFSQPLTAASTATGSVYA